MKPHGAFTRHRHWLEVREAQLRGAIREALLQAGTERQALLAEKVHDTKDEALLKELQDTAMAEVARDTRELAEVRQALQRIAIGGYGACIACGDAIDTERLEANPAATRCLRCQAVLEARDGSD
jgi:DnaK suppressor protein